ncbi:isochorismate synthase [Allosediminivita pacifica]|uniref:isochorismate synthase n=1 Tax=Allosediminivita pacifica TaxID=1267769 RepID=A0A2T6AQM2_9RHOB|nr:isochorismate synthase [Allosediminivita pacifica]PTX46115.1 isochorismate synthase [Allosediminivita pacifica]GGB18164.1 isochorismate synthase EntC [Allosediminivita pacifica]
MTQTPFPSLSQSAGTLPAFAFRNGTGTRVAAGPVDPLARGGVDTLDARLSSALSGLAADGLIGGALPFDRGAEDCLWRAGRMDSSWPVAFGAPATSARLEPQPSAATYAGAVARALERLEADGRLSKVVLARSLQVHSATPISANALLARLAGDPAVMAFLVALPEGGETGRQLVGASPELLVAKEGVEVSSHPLAGSAARSEDPARDRAAAEALAGSAKDRREHALVVEAILDTLSPLCDRLGTPEGTQVTSTGSMWHLGTRVAGRLRDPETPVPLLAAALHPTPAVCGAPRDAAAALIRELEGFERGFYAGATGWCDARGDGAWYVSIRCAELRGHAARLFAGAGIVPGSVPEQEAAETGAKFGAMLRALDLPADALFELED